MISSLFIGSPWSSVGHVCGHSPLPVGHDRGLSKNRSSAQRPDAMRHVRKNWALLIPRIDRERIYSNCKSTVSSVHGTSLEIFFTAKRAPVFFFRRERELRKTRAASESPPSRKS